MFKNACGDANRFLLLAGLIVAFGTADAATVRYTYTGNSFNAFAGTAFDSTMSVNGWFEVDGYLPPSLSNVSVTPQAYSFSNGVRTLTQADMVTGGYSSDLFVFYTDQVGLITGWDISISLNPPPPQNLGDTSHVILTTNRPIDDSDFDLGQYGVCTVLDSSGCSIFAVSRGTVESRPGSWSVTVVPIPAAVWLFGSALAGFGMLGHRTRKV